jgi:hypothetical protein
MDRDSRLKLKELLPPRLSEDEYDQRIRDLDDEGIALLVEWSGAEEEPAQEIAAWCNRQRTLRADARLEEAVHESLLALGFPWARDSSAEVACAHHSLGYGYALTDVLLTSEIAAWERHGRHRAASPKKGLPGPRRNPT